MLPEIQEIKEEVEAGKTPKRTVRELLRWFDAKRRRTGVVDRVKFELADAGIVTSPDFTTVWIDAEISFKKQQATPPTDQVAPVPDGDGGTSNAGTPEVELKDATFLIGMLEAANRCVVSVQPQDTIEKAITLMMAHDFSQLAVMANERQLKGAISWRTIGKRLSQKNELNEVKDAMEDASELPHDAPLFQATRAIIDKDFVFVRSAENQKITGIVTATDLSEQFQSLSEPFLLLGQIENQVRRLLNGIFDIDTLKSACNENDPDRKDKIESVADLTFGEYIRLIQKPENWSKLGIHIDRAVFCDEMEKVRQIRNDVMHFDPDGIEEDQYDQLRRFSRLLGELDKLSGNT